MRRHSAMARSRKAGAVLDAAEALFLDGRDEPAVADEDRGDVTVIGVQAENVHDALTTRGGRRSIARANRA